MDKARRQYLEIYRAENRDKYNAAHRHWRASKYGPPATEPQKKSCRKNPLASLQSKFGIVKPNFVLCMVCWSRVGELGHHKCVLDNGGPEGYASKVGLPLPLRVPLWCEKFASRKSRVSKRRCAPHVRKYWRENPGFLRGRAKPTTWKQTPKGEIVSDAALLSEWILDGRPIEKIAASHGMSNGAVMRRLQRILGFSIRRFFYAVHGEPVTKQWVRNLLRRFQITVGELGRAAGRSRNFADNLTRPSDQYGMPRLASAKLLTRFEHDLITALLASKRISQPSALKGSVPDLKEMYRSLLRPLTWLLSECGGEGTSFIKMNLHHGSEESRREVATSGPYAWRRFLCWLQPLHNFCTANPEWRKKWATASKLATAFLAFDLGCEPWVVTTALSKQTRALPPSELKLRVRFALGEIAKKGGRTPGEDVLTRRRKKLAAAYLKLGWAKTDMAEHVFCDTPKSADRNIWPFFQSHGPAIEVMARLNLTRQQAELITRNPAGFLHT